MTEIGPCPKHGESKKVLAVIDTPTYGIGDGSHPVLRFMVRTNENTGALFCFSQPDADAVIRDFDVRDIRELDTRRCWVCNEDGILRFIRAAKEAR